VSREERERGREARGRFGEFRMLELPEKHSSKLTLFFFLTSTNSPNHSSRRPRLSSTSPRGTPAHRSSWARSTTSRRSSKE
jgi:hypothetical protein